MYVYVCVFGGDIGHGIAYSELTHTHTHTHTHRTSERDTSIMSWFPDEQVTDQHIETELERERKWTVQWNLLSRGKVWLSKPGSVITMGAQTPLEYRNNQVMLVV